MAATSETDCAGANFALRRHQTTLCRDGVLVWVANLGPAYNVAALDRLDLDDDEMAAIDRHVGGVGDQHVGAVQRGVTAGK